MSRKRNFAVFDQRPVVTITGPRQSGKTTLCRMLFPDRASGLGPIAAFGGAP